MNRSKYPTLIVFAGWLAVCLPSLAMTPLSMDFDQDEDGEAIVVGDLEPGAELVVFMVSRSVIAWVPRSTSSADIRRDDDEDSEVTIPLDEAVPAKFVAVAIELSSGRFNVLTPQGSPVREIPAPADSFGQGPGRRFDRLQDHSDLAVMLLVRPGEGDDSGVWSLTTGDGAATDESPAGDGAVWTSASSMQPVGESGPPPGEYQKDDLLIRVAPRVGEYFTARIVR